MPTSQPKKFNIAGPCDPADHYTLPAFPRLPDVQNLINDKLYFVLHAPRQSGKTTSILAAVDQINEEGAYYALNCSLEELRMCTDKDEAMSLIVDGLYGALLDSGVKALEKVAVSGFLDEARARADFNSSPVRVCFKVLCKRLKKNLVVFFDEADNLTEQPLLSFLSQLRRGFTERKKSPFPRSIALIGMVNIRDYKVKIRPESETLGSGSPFNVISKALTLANFTPDEIKDLYAQHTEATGQVFLDEAVQKAYYWSEGQPWLVNALACEVVEEILRKDYGSTITAGLIDAAANNLQKRMDTHIDSLLNRLNEPRVARVIDPMIASLKTRNMTQQNATLDGSFFDDYQYCIELGLIKGDENSYRPANPIYASFMSRYLNRDIKGTITPDVIGKWMDSDSIDMTGLLKAFQVFWVEKSEKYIKGLLYLESAPHLLLTAFLQRVVNGGAQVTEGYALGTGYADIVVKYAGKSYPLELKIKGNEKSRAKSLGQIRRYMNRLLVKEGWLLVFDRDPEKTWPEKKFWDTKTITQKTSGNQSEELTIHVIGL